MKTLENSSIPNIQSIINFYSQSDYDDNNSNYYIFSHMIKRPYNLKLFSREKNILYDSFKEEKRRANQIHSNINRTKLSILELISIDNNNFPTFEFLKQEYIRGLIDGFKRDEYGRCEIVDITR